MAQSRNKFNASSLSGLKAAARRVGQNPVASSYWEKEETQLTASRQKRNNAYKSISTNHENLHKAFSL